ncbi:hypothetical protein TrVE_jg3033 [Triparma verrucosa]|uniref:Uncharacterized protein n=1 Tax=Triparma verrucosa TaxID=1606542 RepID=A0A9W7F1T5_9STRA|nr:hypothetical protein TrVE_jg3033 [Triparma verrucosa]
MIHRRKEGEKRKEGNTKLLTFNVSSSFKRKVLKKLKVDTKLSANHADLEGMLSTVGIFAALILSIQVAIFYAIPMNEMLIGDYRNSLVEFPQFRVFALEKLREMDFPLLYDVGPDKHGDPDILNITSALLDPVCVSAIYGGGTDCYNEREAIMNVDHVFHLTKTAFPLHVITPWLDRNMPQSTLSSYMMVRYNGCTTIIFTLVLLGSIFFYTTLALSDAREGEDEGNLLPTEYYNIIAMPTLMITYGAMIAGIVMFFFNLCFMMLIRAPSYHVAAAFPTIWMYRVLMPGGLMIGLLSFVALIVSNNYKFFEDHKRRKTMDATSSSVIEEEEDDEEQQSDGLGVDGEPLEIETRTAM